MKRIRNRLTIAVCCLLVLLLAAPAVSVHADGGNWNKSLYRFNQFTDVVSETRFNEIEDLAYDNVEIYRFDYPICVINKADLKDATSEEFADFYYEHNDYGYGVDRNGVLLLVIADRNEFLIRGYGSGETVFTGDALKDLKELFYTTYIEDGYAPAFMAYLEEAQRLSMQAVPQNSADGNADEDAEKPEYILDTDTLPMVYDAADIFSDAEEKQMEELIAGIRSKYEKDYVVYTDTTSYDKSHGLQAADFYWDNGYGIGSGRNGGVLFICMESGNRGWWSAGTGSVETYFTERNINDLDDRLEPYMLDGNYGEGVVHYLQDVDALFETGEVPYDKPYGGAAIVAVFIGLIAAGVNVGIKTFRMNTLRQAKAAANYVVPGSLVVRGRSEQFVKSVVSRKRHESSSSSSGSSGGSSYSGSYHSSGGGHFSGGGRKF